MLRAFIMNIPKDLDESAMVDGCTGLQAFQYVIIPVMWPGVITTGLFSFLSAYNDFGVTSILLSKENQTMVPQLASFLGTNQTKGMSYCCGGRCVHHGPIVCDDYGLPTSNHVRPDSRCGQRSDTTDGCGCGRRQIRQTILTATTKV